MACKLIKKTLIRLLSARLSYHNRALSSNTLCFQFFTHLCIYPIRFKKQLQKGTNHSINTFFIELQTAKKNLLQAKNNLKKSFLPTLYTSNNTPLFHEEH